MDTEIKKEVMSMKNFNYAKRPRSNRKWYRISIGQYQVYFWGLPLLPFVVCYDKFKDWQYFRMKWSAERAQRVLDHALPYLLEWVEEDKAYYYCMDWSDFNLWRKASLFDKKWAKKFGAKLRVYLRDEYQKAEFAKSVEQDPYETWVKFAERA